MTCNPDRDDTAHDTLSGWQDISSAPKDRPILAWCDHEADPYAEDKAAGRLTLYAAHAEGLSHAPTGWHIIEWGGGWEDSYEDGGASLPDWWFVAGSEFEVAANPVCWMPLLAPPAGIGRPTMTRSEWLALVERCAAAKGPDRDIDAAIEKATGNCRAFAHYTFGDDDGTYYVPTSYTASLDAITALIGEKLPAAWTWTLGQNIHHRHWVISINNLDSDGAPYSVCLESSKYSPALALCAAFCQAMAERAEA